MTPYLWCYENKDDDKGCEDDTKDVTDQGETVQHQAQSTQLRHHQQLDLVDFNVRRLQLQ